MMRNQSFSLRRLFSTVAILALLAGCDSAGPSQKFNPDDVKTEPLTHEEFMNMLENAAQAGSSDLTVYSPVSEEPLTASEYLQHLKTDRRNGAKTGHSHFIDLDFGLVRSGGSVAFQAHLSATPEADLSLSGSVWGHIPGGTGQIFLWGSKKTIKGTSLTMGRAVYFSGCTMGEAFGTSTWNSFRKSRYKTDQEYCA